MYFRVSSGKAIPIAGEPDINDPAIFDLHGAAKEMNWPESLLVLLHQAVWPPSKTTDPAAIIQEHAASMAVAAALTEWQTDPDKVLIRTRDFAWLNDADFSLFLAKARMRELDVWTGEVYADYRWNHRRKQNELVLIVTIDTMRAIAESTDDYVGIRKPIRGEKGPDGFPLSCSVPVFKWGHGKPRRFEAEIMWEDYYPGPESGTLWDIKPYACFDTAAEAASLRRAFPRPLRKLYLCEEFSKGRRPSGGGMQGAAAVVQDESQLEASAPAATLSDEDIPHTSDGFHRALMDLDICQLPDRAAVVKQFCALHPGLLERDARAFYAVVLMAIRRNPGKWRGAAG